MKEPIIEVSNISKSYKLGKKASYGSLREEIAQAFTSIFKNGEKGDDPTLWALKDVSFEVGKGEVIGIIGRNGAGKSTLLKILSRITEPTSGRVVMRGRVASLLEVGTGFHPELTGRENIFLNGALLGMTSAEIKSKFDEIVAFSEIEKFLDTPVKRYSSGMYVRLAFAVAAHLEPEILIVDEVLAVGDASFQKKCLGKMGDVAKGGRTVLFVSHNMSAVQSLCQRAILLAGGSKIKEGTSHDVVSHYFSNVGESRKALHEFPADPAKRVKIRRVAVRDDRGGLDDVVDLNKNFFVQIDYELTEDVSNLSIGISIFCEENGQCVIQLSDPELDLSRLGVRKRGYYQSVVDIPRKILNTGTYRIRVGAVAFRNVLDVEDSTFFSVIDTVGIVQCIGFERKNSVLSMQLPWKVTHFEAQPEKPPTVLFGG
ncbi:MAG: ABC transporter ATP-binding protein [Deltaproteobacteria bacterium]|nr:ABC transporter ATP-binding protein [Deltaproteobacteria bacterium]